jgi:hypothetical protein
MTRWITVAAMIVLVGGGAARLGPAEGEPGVESELWRTAGIIPFPGSPAAPSFRLSGLSGAPVGLQDFRGRLVMLYFWATW